MSKVVLQPCPFCGSAARECSRENDGPDAPMPVSNWVYCDGGCGAHVGMFGTLSEAITAWNRRCEPVEMRKAG